MAILDKYMAVVAVTVCCSGCYTEFEPDIDSTPVLCMNSMITAGEPVSVRVTHTWFYSGGYTGIERDVSVADAEVSLYANGNHVADMMYSEADMRYHSDYEPVAGDEIEIRAANRTYGNAEARIRIPFPVSVEKVEWDASAFNFWAKRLGYHDDALACSFNMSLNMQAFIADPPNVDNYYKFGWAAQSPDTGDGLWISGAGYNAAGFELYGLDYEYEPLFSEHISVLESVFGSDSYGFTAFTDRQFAGRTYPLHIRFTGGRYDAEMSDPSVELYDAKVVLTLESISRSYYDWLIFDWQNFDGLIGTLGDIGLSEGITGFSNVSTGAGVVAARAVSSYTVSLDEFIKKQVEYIKSQL